MNLWLIFIIISVCATGLLSWPLWRTKAKDEQKRYRLNKAVFDDRMSELKAEKEQKIISDSEYEALVQELKLVFADDFSQNKMAAVGKVNTERAYNNMKIFYSLLLLLVPVIAFLLHFYLTQDSYYDRWQSLMRKSESMHSSGKVDEE